MKCRHETPCSHRCLCTAEIEPCCGYDQCKQFQPDYKTNADHIRSMTDEELAALLDAFCNASACITGDGAVCPFFSDCAPDHAESDWKVWLKQPYEEKNNAQNP